jgi:hypothetical protein
MNTLIRAAAVALALQQAAMVTAELAAQGNGGPAGPTNPACGLVTAKEVEGATGLDYDPGWPLEAEFERIPGGTTCHWGGPQGGPSSAGVVVREDRPEIIVTLIADSPRGSHTEWQRKQQLWQGCTREPVRGSADDAFAEICNQARYVSVYARTGSRDVLVIVRHIETKGWDKASVKPAAIALTSAAVARAKGM